MVFVSVSLSSSLREKTHTPLKMVYFSLTRTGMRPDLAHMLAYPVQTTRQKIICSKGNLTVFFSHLSLTAGLTLFIFHIAPEVSVEFQVPEAKFENHMGLEHMVGSLFVVNGTYPLDI